MLTGVSDIIIYKSLLYW